MPNIQPRDNRPVFWGRIDLGLGAAEWICGWQRTIGYVDRDQIETLERGATMSIRKRRFWLGFCLVIAVGLIGCRRSAPAPSVPQPTALGSGAPVALSPDGGWLLVVKAQDEINEGWLQQVDGTNSRKVLEFTSAGFAAAFSPDGQWLAWTADQLWLARADGSSPGIILDDADVGAIAWSPDSSQLAVVSGDSIQLVNRGGQILREVVAAESIRGLRWVTLSTGERIFFASFPAESPAIISSIQPNGQGQVQLAEAEAFDLAGDRLFIANPLSAGALRVVSAIDGSGPVELAKDSAQSAAARPGGQQVAYVKLSADGTSSDIWLVDVDGSHPQQLTAGSPVLGSNWSPDGKQLYYASFNLNAPETEDPFQVQQIIVP